jgi:hypothetical protein
MSACVSRAKRVRFEGEVELDRSAGKMDFIVDTRAQFGHESPNDDEHRDSRKDGEEKREFETAAEFP